MEYEAMVLGMDFQHGKSEDMFAVRGHLGEPRYIPAALSQSSKLGVFLISVLVASNPQLKSHNPHLKSILIFFCCFLFIHLSFSNTLF